MIIGDRIRFRAIEKADLPNFVHWLNDPEVRQGLSLIHPLSLAEEEEWFKAVLQNPPEGRPLAIEIQPEPGKDEWVFVGNCGLMNIQWENRSAEVGIHIGEKKYWNQGFGSKAMKLMCKHVFDDLNLHRLWLRVFQTNQRAIRAYEKAGFVQEGRMREAQYLDGRYVDVLIMSVLHSEWRDQD
jgi:RimJ/RimL family protein N-acetyltransferase